MRNNLQDSDTVISVGLMLSKVMGSIVCRQNCLDFLVSGAARCMIGAIQRVRARDWHGTYLISFLSNGSVTEEHHIVVSL